MADDARPAAPELPLRRFTRAEFDAMVESGLFREGERVELIGGIITSMMGEGFPHADAVDLMAKALAKVTPKGLDVRIRTRLDIGDDTEVYPDILVQDDTVKASARSSANVHLLVEISDTSLASDRKVKAAAYAEAGFREYWIVDLKARKLWVYRAPAKGKWTDVAEFGEEGAAPLFAPSHTVSIANALPEG